MIMSTYHEWNNAIINYAVQGLSIGAHVFLSIDDETLEAIGFTFNGPRPADGWTEDFRRSIRSHCVHKNRINFSRFINPSLRDTQDRPRYVAFLAAMVLAAHNMGDESEEKLIDSKDFYTHFNNILGLPEQQGRSEGLKGSDVDERLWQDWSAWLRGKGFLPTARSGEGAYKYIGYPISQALLRQSDKNKLWRHFNHSNWRKNVDEVLLMQHIRRDSKYLTMHLEEILDPKGDIWLRAYGAISSACYEVYENWRESDGNDVRLATSVPRMRTSLDAGIYRSSDPISGLIEYRIFPRQTKQSIQAELTIKYDGFNDKLKEDRQGWYAPLWNLDEEQLTSGLEAEITSQNSAITLLFLPARDFWVLTIDPDTPDSGIYASWDKGIELGTEFILLGSQKVHDDLIKLRDEGLLDWQAVLPVFDNWLEYQGVIVQSEPEAWMSLELNIDALRLTLQPRTTFSIGFVEGLRAPRGSGWFVGHGPKLNLASFLPDAYLTVFDESEDVIFSATIEPEHLIEVPWGQSGNYRVLLEQNGQSDEKIVRLVNLADMDPRSMDFDQIADKFNLSIFGTIVKDS
jgi:hypothetical protein